MGQVVEKLLFLPAALAVVMAFLGVEQLLDHRRGVTRAPPGSILTCTKFLQPADEFGGRHRPCQW